MKKIKHSSNKKQNQNKTTNLSKILNSDLFFQSSGAIKMALNKNRLINRDFGIKRARPKIDFGQKNPRNISQNIKEIKKKTKEDELNDNNINSLFRKKEIPFELADIIDNSQIKFEKTFEAFHKLKSKNDIFTSHWHYVQKSNDKIKNKEKKISFNDNKKEEEFYKTFKKYDFSQRDKIELELQKNLTTKIFKSNPLMIKNNNDMLFYYLSMYKDKHLIFKDQNPTKYLNKIKEILDFMEVYVDSKNDKFNQDSKIDGSDFLMKRQKKIEEENLKLKEEQQKQNIIDDIESKKMIGETKKSLKLLNKNKNYFEDPKFNKMSSTFYKHYPNKYLTPNKNKIMNKSSSEFFLGKNSNISLKFLQEKRNNLYRQFSNLLNKTDDKNELFSEKNLKSGETNNNNYTKEIFFKDQKGWSIKIKQNGLSIEMGPFISEKKAKLTINYIKENQEFINLIDSVKKRKEWLINLSNFIEQLLE